MYEVRSDSSLSQDQRAAAVALFDAGMGAAAVATQLGLQLGPVRRLNQRWRVRGTGALVARPSSRVFTFEFKLEVVQRFLAGEPKVGLASELELSSPKLIETWARIYRNEGEDGLRPKRAGRPRAAAAAGESEVERLRRENEYLKAQVAYLGKVRALRAPRPR